MDAAGEHQITPTRIAVGDLVFDALECGPIDGERVILLHGFPQSAATWRSIMPLLGQAGWRVTALQQRGYSAGARPRSTRAYRIGELVGDVVGVADALGAERFHVVGHDWGGAVAWHVAATHPDRLLSLTSLATPHPAALARAMVGTQALRSTYAVWFQVPVVPALTLTAGRNRLLRAALRRSGLSARWVDEYAVAMDRPTMEAALRWYRASSPWELARIGAVEVPTLFVWGAHDPALGATAASLTGEHVHAPYRFRVIGGSHWLPEEHSDVIGQELVHHFVGTRAAV